MLILHSTSSRTKKPLADTSSPSFPPTLQPPKSPSAPPPPSHQLQPPSKKTQSSQISSKLSVQSMPTATPRSFPKRKPWHRPAAGALVYYTEENKAVLLAVEPATKAAWDLV